MKLIPDKIRNSRVYGRLTYDYTMEDIVGESRYGRMKDTKAYKFFSDWAGLGTNKVLLGMYMDSQTGMLPGTSLMARGISLAVHSVTSPIYTVVRDGTYKKGKITPDKPAPVRYAAELVAFNIVQTQLYWMQVGVALGIRSLIDADVDFEIETVGNAAWGFFKNSWWLAPAGKFSMDVFRRFFGSKTPEELADEGTEKLENIVEESAETDAR
jgi:hypothetical protein